MTSPVLVVGSFPPVPVAGAAVTVAEVRRLWAGGDEVVTLSPRLSGAHLSSRISGPRAGRRLAAARRRTGAERLVLVVEAGFPLPDAAGPSGRAAQRAVAASLARALRGFSHVRLVRAGDPGLDPRAWSELTAAAGEIVAAPAGPAAAGVTPLGPRDLTLGVGAGQLARAVVRQVLGEHTHTVKAQVARARRLLGR